MHRHLRRVYGDQQPVSIGPVQHPRRRHTQGLSRRPPARVARRRPHGHLRRDRHAAGRAQLEPARRQPLPALCRRLQHLHGAPPERPQALAQAPVRCREGRVCLGVLCRQQSLHGGHEQCHRPGEDGRDRAGGGRQPERRLLLPVAGWRGPLAQLLPHGRRAAGRRRGRAGRRPGQVYRRRRHEPQVLATPPWPGVADEHARPGPAPDADPLLRPRHQRLQRAVWHRRGLRYCAAAGERRAT